MKDLNLFILNESDFNRFINELYNEIACILASSIAVKLSVIRRGMRKEKLTSLKL